MAWPAQRVPRLAGIGGVEEAFVFGDKVGEVVRVGVVIEGNEAFFGFNLSPGVAFVA